MRQKSFETCLLIKAVFKQKKLLKCVGYIDARDKAGMVKKLEMFSSFTSISYLPKQNRVSLLPLPEEKHKVQRIEKADFC